MNCDSRRRLAYDIAAIVFSISVGVLFGFLYLILAIPFALSAVYVSIGLSALGFILLLATLMFADVTEGHCQKHGIKHLGKIFLFANMGTFLFSGVSLVNGLTDVTILTSLLFGINAFFFMLLIFEFIALFLYLIEKI